MFWPKDSPIRLALSIVLFTAFWIMGMRRIIETWSRQSSLWKSLALMFVIAISFVIAGNVRKWIAMKRDLRSESRTA